MFALIPTSLNQTVGTTQNLLSPATAAPININAVSGMSQTATNLTAAGANLLKLNQQSMTATQGLLPNSTLAVDPALSTAKVGLDAVFASQGASATATDFFKAYKATNDKIASDVKAVSGKISSGVNPTSLVSGTTSGLTALTSVVGSTAGTSARTVSSYLPGAVALSQTGAINKNAAASITGTLSSLQQSGASSGVNTAQIAAANLPLTGAVSSLSQAAKISAPGTGLPSGLPAIPSIPSVPGLPAGIPAIDSAQLAAATQAINAAQNPPNPLATSGAKIGAVDRSKLDSAFNSSLPQGVPSFDPGTISAAQQAGQALNTARFKNVQDKDLTYSGQDPQVWDDINSERLKRGLPGLSTARPSEDSDYVKKYSNPAYNGG